MRRDYALSAAQRADARLALEILAGAGISLVDAARLALDGHRAVVRVTVGEAVERLLLEVARSSKREATKAWHEWKLRPLQADLGSRPIDEVTKADLRQWLAAVTPNEAGRRHYARAARRLWRWALAQDEPLVRADVTAGLVEKTKRAAEVHFLTVEQAEAVLAGAGKYRSAMALALFAGLRPDELAGRDKPALTWRAVQVKEQLVRVPAENAKTGVARVLEGLPEALWAWLKPGKAEEAICPGRSRELARRARDALGLACWPVDCLRHTFATYHVAAWGEPGKTSLLLGHEGDPGLLHRHYRGLATKAAAEAFWALRPARKMPAISSGTAISSSSSDSPPGGMERAAYRRRK